MFWYRRRAARNWHNARRMDRHSRPPGPMDRGRAGEVRPGGLWRDGERFVREHVLSGG